MTEREPPIDPAAHQPTKADLEEDVSVDATPEALAWAVTRGGAKRREDTKSHPKDLDNPLIYKVFPH